jgi:endonuclease YncB( thermonuclease family)
MILGGHWFRSAFAGLLLGSGQGTAAPPPWQTWTNCTLIEDAHNDGDSFRVAHGTNRLVLRLYAVDCPETTRSLKARVADQAKHWGTNTAGVLALGARATEFTRTNLAAAPFTIITRGAHTPSGGRVTGYVTLTNGHDLGAVLLTNGLARVHGYDPRR